MKKLILAAGIILAMGTGGCKQNSQPNLSGTAAKHGGPIPFTEGWSGGNLSATFEIDNCLTHYADSFETDGAVALAYLWDSSSSASVSGGTVALNGTSMPTVDHSADGDGVYYSFNSGAGQTVPMKYDASSLVFSVSGNSNFAALSDSISYVNKKMTLSAPGIADSLSASSGFTISWPHVSGSVDTIAIELHGDTSTYLTSTSNNGSFSVTPAMLSNFGAGTTITVAVTRITYKYATASDGRNYVLACYSCENDEHPLKP